MSDQAAKFIMFGLIAIAVAMFADAIFDTTPPRYQINYPKRRGSETTRLYDPKTGALYTRQDGEWRAIVEGFGGDYEHTPPETAVAVPDKPATPVTQVEPAKAVPDSTSKTRRSIDFLFEVPPGRKNESQPDGTDPR